MRAPKCTPVEEAARYPRKALRSLHYDLDALVVEIQGEGFGFARVVFDNPVGFRVLDERDLCEFWNTYSEPNGWLYQVHQGGWMELEAQRPLFSSPQVIQGLREFLLVDDKCLNVLCTRPPRIIDVGSDPGTPAV